VVVWQTVSPSEGTVEYGTGDRLDRKATDGVRSTSHTVRLTGLEPGTTYSYRVKAGASEVAKGAFTTNQAPGGAAFSFAAFGDSGSGSTEQYEVARAMTAAGVDLAVHVGDVVYPRGEAELYDANFFRPYADLLSGVCIFPIPGNHDFITEGGKPFFDIFTLPANNPGGTERYYSFDFGDAHFIALDTSVGEGRAGYANTDASKMKEWLIADLKSTDKKWKFVYLHEPPYSSGSKHGSDIPTREEFSPVFEEYGVTVVFSGDDHSYERTLPVRQYSDSGPGVVYVVTGGGGANIRPVGTSGFTAYSVQKYHFVKVTVDSESVQIEAVDGKGTVFDRYVIGIGSPVTPYTGPTDQPASELYQIVCARDSQNKSDCDFQADGDNDQVEIRQAVAACGESPCTILLSDGTFSNRAPEESDRIVLRRGVKLLLGADTHIDFTGSEVEDRYVIDIDGTGAPARDVYVGGPGLISVNLAGDHGIRIKGDVADVVIGDGLRLTHNNGRASIDEAVQVTGSDEVRRVTIRDVEITNFGQALGAAHGVELAGLVHDSLFDGLTITGTRNAFALRGDCDRVAGVFNLAAGGGLTRLPQARDNDVSTVSPASLGPGEAVLVRSGGRFNSVRLDLTATNTRPAALSLAVSTGDGQWTRVAIVRDGTAGGVIPLTHDGAIEFDLPPDTPWEEVAISGERGYWVRLESDGAAGVVSVAEAETCQTPYGNTVAGLVARGSVASGISILSARGNTFRDSLIESNGLDGVRSGPVPGMSEPWGNVFTDVRVLNNKGSGYTLRGSPGTVITGGLVSGNGVGIMQEDAGSPGSIFGDGLTVEFNRGAGIVVASDGTTVRKAVVRNNGQDTALSNTFRAGVRVSAGEGAVVADSRLADDQAEPTQSYGVHILPEAMGATVSGNEFAGNKVRALLDEGAGTRLTVE
jgi:hypothetical protein